MNWKLLTVAELFENIHCVKVEFIDRELPTISNTPLDGPELLVKLLLEI